MAICGSRMESQITVQAKTGGMRTGLRWWMKDSTGASHESTVQVPLNDKSTSVLGDALGPAGETDRGKARLPAKALNDLVDEAPV